MIEGTVVGVSPRLFSDALCILSIKRHYAEI